jgi:hypothetical protein
MKKRIFISLLIGFSVIGMLSAQRQEGDNRNRKESFEQFRTKRVAYITERVNFTPEEAEVFWPLANELQEKKFELNKPLWEAKKERQENKSQKVSKEEKKKSRLSRKALTEADYLKLIDINADIQLKEAQLNKEYLEKFKKILSAEKIFKYQKAEEEFMRQIFSPRNHKSDKDDK